MPSSYGYSAAPERRRTTGPAELLAGLLLIAVVCWLAFPRDLASTLRSARLDAVSLSYADTWLRAKPDDYALRLVLADRLMDLGLVDRARRQLDYVGAHTDAPQWRGPQRWLRARLLFTALMALPPRRRSNDPLQDRARRALAEVDAGTLDDRELEEFADMALSLDRVDRAVDAWHLLAARSPTPAIWYARAGDALLAHGRYRDAADQYLRAMAAAHGGPVKRGYFLKALDTLQSGNRLADAMDVAARYQRPYLKDPDTLYRLMNLARAAGNTERAQFYAVRLLQLGALSAGGSGEAP